MAEGVRTVVVGTWRAGREAREVLRTAGVAIITDVSTVTDVPADSSVDALLIANDRLVDELADDWDPGAGVSADRTPALVVITRDERVASVVSALGPRGWAVVSPDDSPSDLAIAIHAAASGFAVRPATSAREEADEEEYGPAEALTAREREVLELVAQGLPNKAVAARLSLSDHTVKFHLSSIFSKLGVATRTEAVRRGVRAGLITF